jgi:hypothetical protein
VEDAYADPNTVWPPNKKMIGISILGVTDPDGDDITIHHRHRRRRN